MRKLKLFGMKMPKPLAEGFVASKALKNKPLALLLAMAMLVSLIALPLSALAAGPTVVAGAGTQTGSATPASEDTVIAAVPYTADVSGWFEGGTGTITYAVVSDDADGVVGITTSTLTFTPEATDAGETRTIVVKAICSDNGDSTGNVTVTVTVGAVPLSNAEKVAAAKTRLTAGVTISYNASLLPETGNESDWATAATLVAQAILNGTAGQNPDVSSVTATITWDSGNEYYKLALAQIPASDEIINYSVTMAPPPPPPGGGGGGGWTPPAPAPFTSTKTDPEEKVVDVFYMGLLGRSYDEEGFAYWVAQLESGAMTYAQVARHFIFSEEVRAAGLTDVQFVTRLYNGLLGRNPDASGLDFWVAHLGRGVSKEAIFNAFVASTEFAARLTALGLKV